MPANRGNPSHRRLPVLVGNNLLQLRERRRWRLSGQIHQLYNLRIIADYLPRSLVEEGEARVAITLMVEVFHGLKGAS